MNGIHLLQLSVDKSGEKIAHKEATNKKYSLANQTFCQLYINRVIYILWPWKIVILCHHVHTITKFSVFLILYFYSFYPFLGTRWARYNMYYSWLGATYVLLGWLVSELNGQLAGQTVSWIGLVTFYILVDFIMYALSVKRPLCFSIGKEYCNFLDCASPFFTVKLAKIQN